MPDPPIVAASQPAVVVQIDANGSRDQRFAVGVVWLGAAGAVGRQGSGLPATGFAACEANRCAAGEENILPYRQNGHSPVRPTMYSA